MRSDAYTDLITWGKDMTAAQATFDVYTQLGILKGCKSLSVRFNRDKGLWEITAKFQDAKGIRIGKVAEFEQVNDAVDFRVLAGF